ncbi:MAG: hypothetical protein QF473_28065 [Planctomycetota bacterium]|jgi:clan AA aspartic protease|nr:hypothetical protein [Planctomycetota bacterium]
MKGTITADHTASVGVTILESGGVHTCVVDTGFTEFLYLPANVIAAWNLVFLVSTPIELADGSTVITDVYEATLEWFGVFIRATVIAGPAGCDSLIGMQLLEGCRIELDAANAEIRIDKL